MLLSDEISIIFEKLFDFYNASNIRELSKKIDTSESTVSKWKQRKSINAIKKKCRELGIYNEIFGAQNIQTIGSISGGQVTQKVQGDQNYNNHPDNNEEDSMKYNIQHDNIVNANDIDAATFNLFLEAYEKSLKNNDVNDLRVYLMDY